MSMLLLLCALTTAALAQLSRVQPGFYCNNVNPNDPFQVCKYNGRNESVFLNLQPVDGAVRAVGLNGSDDQGHFVGVWRTTQGARGKIVSGDGKLVKSLTLSSAPTDSMPSVAALSGGGFVVAVGVTVAKQSAVKLLLFSNNGSQTAEVNANLDGVAGEPIVAAVSENRYVLLVKTGALNTLSASVWFLEQRINLFKVTSGIESFKAVGLSGDSYVVVTRDRATDEVRLFAYRANSEQAFTIAETEVQGIVARDSDAFDVVPLADNNFVVAVTAQRNVSVSIFNFKDAQKLRENGGDVQATVRVTTPQERSNVVYVRDAAGKAYLTRRANGGFLLAYNSVSGATKVAAFKDAKGAAAPTVTVVNAGPNKPSARVAQSSGNGVVVSFVRQDNTPALRFLTLADLRENATATAGQPKKRQVGETTTTTTVVPPTTTTSAPATTATTKTTTKTSTTTLVATTPQNPAPTEPSAASTTAAAAAATTTTTTTTTTEDQASDTTEPTSTPVADVPSLLLLANGNVALITTTSKDPEMEDARLSATYRIYQNGDDLLAKGDFATDDSIVALGELLDSPTTAASSLAVAAGVAVISLATMF